MLHSYGRPCNCFLIKHDLTWPFLTNLASYTLALPGTTIHQKSTKIIGAKILISKVNKIWWKILWDPQKLTYAKRANITKWTFTTKINPVKWTSFIAIKFGWSVLTEFECISNFIWSHICNIIYHQVCERFQVCEFKDYKRQKIMVMSDENWGKVDKI